VSAFQVYPWASKYAPPPEWIRILKVLVVRARLKVFDVPLRVAVSLAVAFWALVLTAAN
jgi:hypothetical protein